MVYSVHTKQYCMTCTWVMLVPWPPTMPTLLGHHLTFWHILNGCVALRQYGWMPVSAPGPATILAYTILPLKWYTLYCRYTGTQYTRTHYTGTHYTGIHYTGIHYSGTILSVYSWAQLPVRGVSLSGLQGTQGYRGYSHILADTVMQSHHAGVRENSFS